MSVALVLALAIPAAATLGCSPRTRHSTRSDASTTLESTAVPAALDAEASTAPRLPRSMTITETRMPDFSVGEFELPPGCEVTDNTDSLAAYAQNTGRQYPTSVFGLMDLASGKQRIVLTEPAGTERSFDAFTPMLSDDWLAWEEVSAGEANAMRDAKWRLYAARIDRAQLRIGSPVLVDEASTDYKLRPHYGVEGSVVYWSVSTVPSRTTLI